MPRLASKSDESIDIGKPENPSAVSEALENEVRKKNKETTYKLCVFSAKQVPWDSDDVQLIVNGRIKVIAREKPVIVPDYYLECADHTMHIWWTMKPGQDRKSKLEIKTYPYSIIRDATKEEYESQLFEGNKIMQKVKESMGEEE